MTPRPRHDPEHVRPSDHGTGVETAQAGDADKRERPEAAGADAEGGRYEEGLLG